MTDVGERLAELRDSGLHRKLRLVRGPQGARVQLDGREVLMLCSNNYLGLADHPAVCRAAAGAAMRWGAGAGASRLVSGNMTPHRRLEERLAAFKGTESALLYGSGYLANIGTVTALAREGEVVFSDELNHASLVDGCRLAKAETFVYRHADLEHLAWGLQKAGDRGSLIATDSVFSMDGDVAPLPELVELAARHDCRVLVDEAHATGTLGPGGRGAVAEAGLDGEVDVIVATLGKALGSYGACVCTSREIVDLLVNASRPFIFSTALPPAAAAGALAALEELTARPERVERLQRNASLMRAELAGQGVPVEPSSRTQILPVVVGDPSAAMELCEGALRRGAFAQAIRPPSVPAGSSRLRITVMATHHASDLKSAARAIGAAAEEVGVAKGPSVAQGPWLGGRVAPAEESRVPAEEEFAWVEPGAPAEREPDREPVVSANEPFDWDEGDTGAFELDRAA